MADEVSLRKLELEGVVLGGTRVEGREHIMHLELSWVRGSNGIYTGSGLNLINQNHILVLIKDLCACMVRHHHTSRGV